MDALQFKLDTIANNLTNSNTTAFKEKQVNVEDLFYQYYKLRGQLSNQGNTPALGIDLGVGTRVRSTQPNMIQGSLQQTGAQLALAVVGNGFFQIQDASQMPYSR